MKSDGLPLEIPSLCVSRAISLSLTCFSVLVTQFKSVNIFVLFGRTPYVLFVYGHMVNQQLLYAFHYFQ